MQQLKLNRTKKKDLAGGIFYAPNNTVLLYGHSFYAKRDAYTSWVPRYQVWKINDKQERQLLRVKNIPNNWKDRDITNKHHRSLGARCVDCIALLGPGERVGGIICESRCYFSTVTRHGFRVSVCSGPHICLTENDKKGFDTHKGQSFAARLTDTKDYSGPICNAMTEHSNNSDYTTVSNFARANKTGDLYSLSNFTNCDSQITEWRLTHYPDCDPYRPVQSTTINLPGADFDWEITDLDVTNDKNNLVAAVVRRGTRETKLHVYDISSFSFPRLLQAYAWPCTYVALSPDDLVVAMHHTGKRDVKNSTYESTLTFADMEF